MVRTNIVLDEKLVKEAMKLANVKTKREAVDIALRRFVHSGKQGGSLSSTARAVFERITTTSRCGPATDSLVLFLWRES